jgi:hypothetical protein
VKGFATGQHLNELFNAFGPSLSLLGIADPVEDRIPVGTRQRLEHRLSLRIGEKGLLEILGNLRAGLPGVGGLPPTVCLRLLDLSFARSMHAAGEKQPLGDRDIPLLPRTPSTAGREPSPERRVVPPPELPVDPSKADRFVECLVVGQCRRLRRALLGENEPDSLWLGVVARQPDAPCRGISHHEFWKLHQSTVTRRLESTAASAHVGNDESISEIDGLPLGQIGMTPLPGTTRQVRLQGGDAPSHNSRVGQRQP